MSAAQPAEGTPDGDPIDAYVERIVAAAPRFTDRQLQRIAAVLDASPPTAPDDSPAVAS